MLNEYCVLPPSLYSFKYEIAIFKLLFCFSISTKAFFFFLAEANVSRQIHQSGTAPELSEVCPTVHASGVGASDQLAPGEGIPISSASPTA